MIGRLKFIQCYDIVVYYSIAVYDDDDQLITTNGSLFEDFIHHHQSSHKEQLNFILEWIQQIGNIKGALQQYFRFENDAGALPPPTRIAQNESVSSIQNIQILDFDMRLYCLRLNENVVILFNGGIKTENRAQDCTNVRGHFNQANILAQRITAAIINQEIEISDDDILYDDDFEINF